MTQTKVQTVPNKINVYRVYVSLEIFCNPLFNKRAVPFQNDRQLFHKNNNGHNSKFVEKNIQWRISLEQSN